MEKEERQEVTVTTQQLAGWINSREGEFILHVELEGEEDGEKAI